MRSGLSFALIGGVLLLARPGAAVGAETTRVDVRVRSLGAKFVGSSMGGARVIIRDAATCEILAEGKTRGTTGDTARIMKETGTADRTIATADAGVFETQLNLTEPTRIQIQAAGPLAQPQAIQEVSRTQWVIPGRDLTGGDGVLLTLPGFVVDVLSPPAHMKLEGAPQTVELRANVTLMCGCPIEPGGLWDAEGYQIRVILERDGEKLRSVPLKFAGQTSQFQRTLTIDQPGVYVATVFAFDPDNGNTGVDKVSFIVSE